MGLGATYDLHLRLIGKLVGDFLLVIIELFFARCFRFVTIHAFDRWTTDGRTDRRTESRQQYLRMLRSRTVKMINHDLIVDVFRVVFQRRSSEVLLPGVLEVQTIHKYYALLSMERHRMRMLVDLLQTVNKSVSSESDVR